MNAVDRLKRDHQILRAKLGVLEGALQMGSEAWFVLRELCYTLSRQLANHIQREEALVQACRDALAEQALAHIVVEHKDEPELLRTINRLFVDQQGHSLEVMRPGLLTLIQGLRTHIAEEAAELFPVLERVLAAREALPTRDPQPTSRITEIMTVNQILRAFPATRRIFDSLFVNVLFESCDCLDEVAWRRGMEAQDLISQLEAVITSCGCQKSETPRPTESVSIPEETEATV